MPRFQILQPSASRPPSAKKSAWTVRTEAMTRKAAWGPRRMARIIPPPRCPLEPVPGIVKLIICAAKMKAPSTPIRGIVLSSIRSFSFFDAYPPAATDPAHSVVPTAGESKASAMCIVFPP